MNSVIKDIRLQKYILNSKYNVILINKSGGSYRYNHAVSIYLITWFHEQQDYKYLTNKIYFELKI